MQYTNKQMKKVMLAVFFVLAAESAFAQPAYIKRYFPMRGRRDVSVLTKIKLNFSQPMEKEVWQ